MGAERIAEANISSKVLPFPSEEREEIDRIDWVFSKVRRAKQGYLQANSSERVNLQNVFSKNSAVWVAAKAGEQEGYNQRLALCKITPAGKREVGVEVVFIQFAKKVTPENYQELLENAALEAPTEGVFLEDFHGVLSVLDEGVRSTNQGLLRTRGVLAGCTKDRLGLPEGNLFCQNLNPAIVFSREMSRLHPGVLATSITVDGTICPCDLEIVPRDKDQLHSLEETFGKNLANERVLGIAVTPKGISPPSS